MTSVEALDFALRILRNRQRRLALPDGPTAESIETLSALRDLIEDQTRSAE